MKVVDQFFEEFEKTLFEKEPLFIQRTTAENAGFYVACFQTKMTLTLLEVNENNVFLNFKPRSGSHQKGNSMQREVNSYERFYQKGTLKEQELYELNKQRSIANLSMLIIPNIDTNNIMENNDLFDRIEEKFEEKFETICKNIKTLYTIQKI